MAKPIKKILLFLSLIIICPILFLVGRELVTMNTEEKLIRDIYKGQLESILFSVNQYSEDLIRSWMIKVQSELEISRGDNEVFQNRVKYLFKEARSISYLFMMDESRKNIYVVDSTSLKRNRFRTDEFINRNANTINRLIEYRKASYKKISPINYNFDDRKEQLLLFILNDNIVAGFAIKPEVFVNQNLAGKIESIARDEFIAKVFDTQNGGTIYSTSNQSEFSSEQNRGLWLIPNYSIAISLRGRTIESLIQEKMLNNIILISMLSVFMLVAAFWGYRNIKKEIELAQIKSDFVSNVSHELRTPLALISMFAETLSMRRVKTEEKKQEYYDIIHQETERLSKIVNKILSFAKIEAGKWKYNFAIKDLNEIVSRVFDTYKFHLKNSGFKFELELCDSQLMGRFDAETISEALINLIDNAIKYSADEKYLKLSTGKSIKGVYVEARDHGIGVSADEQKKIFDKFYRVTSGEIHNTKGTGLGLTLVQHIVDAHKGQIVLKSEAGKGSTFTLLFPYDENIKGV